MGINHSFRYRSNAIETVNRVKKATDVKVFTLNFLKIMFDIVHLMQQLRNSKNV